MTPTHLSPVLVLLACFPYALTQSTARFKLELSWGRRAPDGVERDMILVNGQFPGPTLEITEGDDVVVEVYNGLGADSSIHFHGKPRFATQDASILITYAHKVSR